MTVRSHTIEPLPPLRQMLAAMQAVRPIDNQDGRPAGAASRAAFGSHRSNRSLRKRNRSLDALAPKFRILKIYRAETGPGNLALRHEMSDIPRQRPGSWPLSFGNVRTSVSTRNP
jgi:hypothetical protein